MKSCLRTDVGLVGVLVVLVWFSLVAAYFQTFSSMASYDDEGAFITWVQDLVSGRPLYDRVQTPYGPLYFAYEWLAHGSLGIPVSNNSIRMVDPLFRVAAVLLLFLLSYKMTGSTLISWGAGIVAFGELGFISREPAHPQALCIVLLLALALAGCFKENRIRLMLIMGALSAGMALTKINVGIFAVAAVGVAAIFFTKNSRRWLMARVLVACTALMLPAALMMGMLGRSWVVRYCAVETVAIAAALIVVSQVPNDVRLGVRELMAGVFGFAVSLVLISWFAIASGSSLSAMIDCLVLSPRRAFGPVWFYAVHTRFLAIPWAVVCLGLAWSTVTGRLNTAMIASLKLLLAALVFGFCLTDRPGALMSFALPMLWLVAIPSGGRLTGPASNFSRALLLLISVIQFLYAFPVAGEQMQFMKICPIAVAAVCLADAFRELEIRLPQARILANGKGATIFGGVLLASICWFTAWNAVRTYASRPTLQLRGARLIHLNSEDTRVRQEIVRLAAINACTTLITVPGMPSFNAWTGVKKPPSQASGPWLLTMNVEGQANLVRQLSGDPLACVIVNRQMGDLWSSQNLAYSSPMARFIRDNFRPEFDSVPYQFLVRR